MKIGIAYTKQNNVGIELCDALYEGILKVGSDNVCQIRSVKDWQKCDVIFQLCPYNNGGSGPEIPLRKLIQERHKGPTLIIDSGFFSQSNKRWTNETTDRYFAIGLDGIKGKALYFSEHKENDDSRWQQLNIELKPHNNGKGNNILLLGQHEEGVSTKHLKRGFINWLEDTIERLELHTNKQILLRPHPNQRQFPQSKRCFILDKGNKIEDDLKNVCAVICLTTNGSTDAIVNGISLYCSDPICISYEVAFKSLNDRIRDREELFQQTDFPSEDRRRKWLNKLSWQQWSIKEMKEGLVWQFWKDKIS